jgi:hypothetical protein
MLLLIKVFPKYGRFLLTHLLHLTRINGVTCHKKVTLAQYFSRKGHLSGYLSRWGELRASHIDLQTSGKSLCHFLSNLKGEKEKLLLLVFLQRWVFVSFTGTRSFLWADRGAFFRGSKPRHCGALSGPTVDQRLVCNTLWRRWFLRKFLLHNVRALPACLPGELLADDLQQ